MKRILFIPLLFITGICFGAEFLVIADTSGQFNRGDILQAFPDGKLSDYANAKGKFFVIRVKGLSYKNAIKYQAQWYSSAKDSNDNIILNERKYHIDYNLLSKQTKNTLQKKHVWNTTFNTFFKYVRDKSQ